MGKLLLHFNDKSLSGGLTVYSDSSALGMFFFSLFFSSTCIHFDISVMSVIMSRKGSSTCHCILF